MTDSSPKGQQPSEHYHGVSKLFHWLIAGLIVLQYVSHELAEYAAEHGARNWEFSLVLNHKSVGMTILLLAVARLLWRLANTPPQLPLTMPRWQVGVSQVSHWLLYALMFAIPLTGWLMSSAAGVSVAWFKIAYFPDLIGSNEGLAETLHEIHELLAKGLFVVAVIHILAALKHAVVNRDGVLGRICSIITVGVGAMTVGLGAWWLTLQGTPSASAQSAPAQTTAAETEQPGSNLPRWSIDYETSYIRFAGTQSDTPFEGDWQAWSAVMHFDPRALGDSFFDVTIDAASAATGDSDRDTTMQDADWFDAAAHPEVFYRVTAFRALANDRFAADGELTIKGLTSPVTLEFSVASSGDSRVLTGSAELHRLALGVGTGDWTDTAWVEDEVAVTVQVTATVADD